MKSRKEKIVLGLVIFGFIATFVVGFGWGYASSHELNQTLWAISAIILGITTLVLKNYHHDLMVQRRIEETVDSVMDAIIEFRKETLKNKQQNLKLNDGKGKKI